MRSQSGQSLIQVLVSVAIMAVVLTAMSTMFGSLNRETKSMSEKLGAMDLEKLLIGALNDGSACIYALNNPTPLTFNAATSVSPSAPLVIPLPSDPANPARLYSSHNPTASPALGPVVVEVGRQAAPYSSSLVVKAISLELTGISGANAVGRWRIDFDNSRMVRALKPAYVSVALKADISTPAAATFTSCQVTALPGSGPGGSGEWCGSFITSNNTGTQYVNKVLMPCKGKAPSCAPGMIYSAMGAAAIGGACRQGVFHFGWDVNSVCPAGYTPKELFTYVAKYTPASGSTEIGTYMPAQIDYETLITCSP